MTIDFNRNMTLLWRTWRTNPLWLQPYAPSAAQIIIHIDSSHLFSRETPHSHTHTHTPTGHMLSLVGNPSNSGPWVANDHILLRRSQLCSIYSTNVCNAIAVEGRGCEVGSAVMKWHPVTRWVSQRTGFEMTSVVQGFMGKKKQNTCFYWNRWVRRCWKRLHTQNTVQNIVQCF